MNRIQHINRLAIIRQVAQHTQRRRQLALLVDALDRHAELSETELSTVSLERQKTYAQPVDKSEIPDMPE